MNNNYYVEQFNNFFKTIGRSVDTIKTYDRIIEMFLNYSNKQVAEITKQDIREFLNSNNDKSSATINLYLRAINSFFEVLINDLELIDMSKSPAYDVRVPKLKTKHRNSITREQVMSLLKYSKNSRDKAIIMLYFNTGLRVHELIALTVKQYKERDEFDSIELTVTKGSKERVIYLNSNTIEMIDEYLKTRKECGLDNLFISNGGKQMDASCIRKTLKTIAKRSGAFDEEEINSLCNHTLRHTFATELENNNVPLQTISNAMGHASINTTMLYLDLNKQNIRNAMCSI